ncbi:conserved Plasmodium protein, unknown function [Plasmodium knowlesi strain H]|uniref:OTU domain-containing protein n=3 Tax=Plasmodium knowlesi TaxID=5850 RepID=A0A5K1VDW6_PLAKH|nr:conserved Plasmodium protein, unknown function [Plasmodium knowlesi strain H]OTN66204.1 Uncharacterized protein PKNOH_S09548500 [Plasmodium knowlesi]CAA9989829.1 conserved Plasmodium protein, unknown function [Plasmodium knowlesi strain H]SBO24377.1 conserved Plasmodium protein, unknown function [Plasmodium knowlesi strain H]SBO26646.1 conserved Plasmodium protein, unknown function [Plasmodium knowlesi strain H]VVS79303.1 conserved Plasmodium protein, unknown function [Plasmodium knowlesi s|eukprot:XP_002259844.1 hypothetical protein, conserved in Plasmodium species [Plasmodium knowlesi strain H]
MAWKREAASWPRVILVATLFSFLCSVLLALRINKEDGFINKLENDSEVKVSTVVFNMRDEKMYVDDEHFDNLRTLQNMLLHCFKTTEKKLILKDIGIDNVKYLFYENFKNEVYEYFKLFFKFIKENFPYFTKRLQEEKKNNNLSEEDYLSNDKLQELLEDVISYEIEKNAFYFEKLVQFITLRKCFTMNISANVDNTAKLILLLMEVDSKKKQVHFKLKNNISAEELQGQQQQHRQPQRQQHNHNNTTTTQQQQRQQQQRQPKQLSSHAGGAPPSAGEVPVLETTINPPRTGNLVMRTNKNMSLPMSYFKNLCIKNNFQVASRNWIEFFYRHNETLCHVETCGSGDCLFLSLQYLLDKNGVRTNNVIPNAAVPESSFLPWYIRNVKQTDDPKFNVNDLRYLSTFYFIKYFPGYTEDYEIDEQFINEKFDLLINLEFTNYYLKKDYLYKVMKDNKDDEKNKSVLVLISNYMNKYLFSGGRPPIANTEEGAALCRYNTCQKGNTQGPGPSGNHRNGRGNGWINEKRGGGPIRGRDQNDDDDLNGNHNSKKRGNQIGGGKENSHKSPIRRSGNMGSSGNLSSGPSGTRNKNAGDFQNVMEESESSLNPNRGERSLNSNVQRGMESMKNSDDNLSISGSQSGNAVLADEDKKVQFQKVEEGGEGNTSTKDAYFRVSYGPNQSPESTSTVKHDSVTISLKRNSSDRLSSSSDSINSSDSGSPTVPRNQPLRISSKDIEKDSAKVAGASTLKYTDKRKNVEVSNSKFTESTKGNYEHVVVPHSSGTEESTDTEESTATEESIATQESTATDMMKPKRYLTKQGLLCTTPSCSPDISDIRLVQHEKDKKSRLYDKTITQSEESTDDAEESEKENKNGDGIDEEHDSNKRDDSEPKGEMSDYNDILEEVHEGGYRIYELIFFKLVSLSANKMTYDELKGVKKKNIHTLVGTDLKSKIIGSHVFMKKITQGTILPFFNYINLKNKLNNVNRKLNYANPDLYVIITKTTFNKEITRPKDGLVTKSLLFKHNGDCISYWSIKNNHYHFTCDNKVIQTKTIEEKASAFFYERTRTGHIHWGDETDYDGFQKMFNIGLITFINNSTKFFFPRNTFQDYPIYFLIYFYSGVHFEPSIHISVQDDQEVCRSSYDRNTIPPSFLKVPKE